MYLLMSMFKVNVMFMIFGSFNSEVPFWTEFKQLSKLQKTKTSNTRIVGGTNALLGEAPWQISIVPVNNPMVNTNKEVVGHFCGGALIGVRTILTAAHCVSEDERQGMVITKPQEIKVKYNGINRQRLHAISEVTEVILHPKYVSTGVSIDYDIAILRLKDPVVESTNVKIIKIAESSPLPGSNCRFTGWGVTSGRDGERAAIMLKSAEMIIIRKSSYKETRPGMSPPSARFIGTRSLTASACNTDSGSPLTFNNTLVGVLSHGTSHNCSIGSVQFFTDPVTVKRWINFYNK